MNAVYNTQCKTFMVAKELAKKEGDVSTVEAALKVPYCLRVVKQYRTPAMITFRNEVAVELRRLRNDVLRINFR